MSCGKIYGITAFNVMVTAKAQNASECLSRWYFLCVSDHVHSVSPELLYHFSPNLVWRCIIMRQSVMQKNWFTIFSVKVTASTYIIKIWLFSQYLLNCWSVCNCKLDYDQHHKPECPVEKWDCCIQGHDHSEGSKCLWIFVQTISSEPQNILLPNLVWLCNIISQSVM